jgi:hypothetical protein
MEQKINIKLGHQRCLPRPSGGSSSSGEEETFSNVARMTFYLTDTPGGSLSAADTIVFNPITEGLSSFLYDPINVDPALVTPAITFEGRQTPKLTFDMTQFGVPAGAPFSMVISPLDHIADRWAFIPAQPGKFHFVVKDIPKTIRLVLDPLDLEDSYFVINKPPDSDALALAVITEQSLSDIGDGLYECELEGYLSAPFDFGTYIGSSYHYCYTDMFTYYTVPTLSFDDNNREGFYFNFVVKMGDMSFSGIEVIDLIRFDELRLRTGKGALRAIGKDGIPIYEILVHW